MLNKSLVQTLTKFKTFIFHVQNLDCVSFLFIVWQNSAKGI